MGIALELDLFLFSLQQYNFLNIASMICLNPNTFQLKCHNVMIFASTPLPWKKNQPLLILLYFVLLIFYLYYFSKWIWKITSSFACLSSNSLVLNCTILMPIFTHAHKIINCMYLSIYKEISKICESYIFQSWKSITNSIQPLFRHWESYNI